MTKGDVVGILRVSVAAEPEGVTDTGDLAESHFIKLNASDIRAYILHQNPGHDESEPFRVNVTLTVEFDPAGIPTVMTINA